ncbi:hypothetical protein [Psychrobacter sp. UBA6291]|uniref:hypothetical protein n=1 Tax=Psychrobacter sp. UBA6291 TaxID=1947357 RepID=UPI00257D05AD|nr:hypothetical protein [Psychrobacter sp. UBA6291]
MRVTNKQMVLDAIIDLNNQEQSVTRETLSGLIDLSLAVIDEKLTSLVNDGLIYRIQRGVYLPVVTHDQARVISKIVLPCGTVKIDIGDDVWTLTPKEARIIGSLMVADAMQYSNIEIGHHAALTTAKMDLQTKEMRRDIKELQRLLASSNHA